MSLPSANTFCRHSSPASLYGRKVCHNQFRTLTGNESCTDKLGKRVRDIIEKELHGIEVPVTDKASRIGKVGKVVLREILHLNNSACPTPGAVCTVELKHTSGTTIGTYSGFHSLVFLYRGFGKLLTEC